MTCIECEDYEKKLHLANVIKVEVDLHCVVSISGEFQRLRPNKDINLYDCPYPLYGQGLLTLQVYTL